MAWLNLETVLRERSQSLFLKNPLFYVYNPIYENE